VSWRARIAYRRSPRRCGHGPPPCGFTRSMLRGSSPSCKPRRRRAANMATSQGAVVKQSTLIDLPITQHHLHSRFDNWSESAKQHHCNSRVFNRIESRTGRRQSVALTAARDPIRRWRQGSVRRRSPTVASCCRSPDTPSDLDGAAEANADPRRFPWHTDRAIISQLQPNIPFSSRCRGAGSQAARAGDSRPN
jgi:hypothetical protein